MTVPSEPAKDKAASGRKDDRGPGHLLVVDDNEMNRDMLSRRLARRGYTVDTACDGDDALQKIADCGFDLILLDIMMPGISGLEVLERLRAEYSLADLPVIMATAKDRSDDIVGALKLGANDYVTKPLDFPVVLARVASQLALKRANEEIRRLAAELEVRNEFIRNVFGRYLSEDIVTNLLETPEGLCLGGEKREITILMCDIRGFSIMSANLPPDQVVSIVNNFLSVMTDVILDFGGTIDEFIGDAILVLFGAPMAMADHAVNAVACAIGMQKAVAGVNERNRAQGLPEVEMGVGINTGEVVVGNIGSEKRAKYGVVGSNVNLAARIEGYTVGGQVLISAATRSAVGDAVRVRGSMEVHPKGADTPITLFEVASLQGPGDLTLPEAATGLVELATPISAQITVMTGKDTGGERREEMVTALSLTHAVIGTPRTPIGQRQNVKIKLIRPDDAAVSGSIFAKVLSRTEKDVTVRFTSVPEGLESFIAGLLR